MNFPQQKLFKFRSPQGQREYLPKKYLISSRLPFDDVLPRNKLLSQVFSTEISKALNGWDSADNKQNVTHQKMGFKEQPWHLTHWQHRVHKGYFEMHRPSKPTTFCWKATQLINMWAA